MTAELLDGKALAEEIRYGLKKTVSGMKVKPGLAVIQIGNDPASTTYIAKKQIACEEIGIHFEKHHFDDIDEDKLISFVETLNQDGRIHGILVQMPLPKSIDPVKVLLAISPYKDVDGFHPNSVGCLAVGLDGFKACTPKGIMRLLDHYDITVTGKHAVVIGRSNIVGKPLALMLLGRDATVTVCHSRTKDLAKHTRDADILISAVGRPGLIRGDMVKKGAVVIDVGTTKVDGKLRGDVDFAMASEVASHITPVPGGIGPMTIAMLMENTVEAAKGIRND